MKNVSRRDLLKSSLLVPAAAVAHGMTPMASAMQAAAEHADQHPASSAPGSAQSSAERERLLLDFGWRFHLGNANDLSKDFGFGSDSAGNFQKTGNFIPSGTIAFDDGDWNSVDLPHDWAVELPYKNDRELANKGFHPLGRNYPESSVGWYRRVLEIPAADAGKRITLEFDGAYREAMVVFNGFYVGRHSGGYDPFSFDVTPFATPGGRNVLLVRVDATSSDGWFYEGAGIYRHVWMVKTNPVHVKQLGTFVATRVEADKATLSIRTEVENHGKDAQNARVVSIILDPSGKEVGKTASTPESIAVGGEQTFNDEISLRQPQLWSLEERNLYKLVTEIRAGSEVLDRCETRFGIRSLHIDS